MNDLNPFSPDFQKVSAKLRIVAFQSIIAKLFLWPINQMNWKVAIMDSAV